MTKKTLQFLTIAAIAKELSCTQNRVRNAIWRHELRAHNIGSEARPEWRVERSDLDEYLNRKANFSDERKVKARSREVPPREVIDFI